MNKFLIVLLAVCLVGVCHAFVKRETEGAPNSESLQKQAQDALKSIQDQLTKAFDPEALKKTFSETVDGLSKALNDLQSKSEGAKQ